MDFGSRPNEQSIEDLRQLYCELLMKHSRDIILFIRRENGRILEANSAAVEAYGYSREQLTERTIFDLRFSKNNAHTVVQMEEAATNGILFETLHRRKDGSIFPVEVSSRGINWNGKLILVSIIRDISDRKLKEKLLWESEQLYRTAAKNFPNGFLYVFDRDLRIRMAGGTSLADIGYSPEGVEGTTIYDLDDEAQKLAVPRCLRVFDGESLQYETRYRERIFQSQYVPIRDDCGEVSLGLVIAHDITERKRVEDELKDSREDLNRAQAVAHTGSWRLNVRTNELIWSDETYRIFGLPRDKPLSYETFLETVHPEDREYVKERWHAALQGEPYDIEHRVLVNDTVKWVREKAELEFCKDGSLLGGFGTVQDITEKKQAENTLRLLNENLEQQVAERTEELEKTIWILESEIVEREQAQAELRRLTGKTMEVMEHDRRAVSKEIHDSIGGSLAAIKMLLETRFEQLPPESMGCMQEIIGHLSAAIKESKHISHQLRPRALDELGLIAGLLEFMGKFNQFYPNIKIKERIHISPNNMPEEIKTAVYRIVQEALNNIGKHSRATSAEVELIESENQLMLKIEDNGIGFDVSSTFDTGHPLQGYGLLSMKERVEICRGIFDVKSSPGKGTCLTATIPRYS